ncbi:MerR family transcriptional regulator [Nonomuraea sp. NPDC050790]|uniref:helix-turn-helix domain-containing protein n=1 Tax=Nonomuraea sp. NPDC050790 TaxID=3364371 RepID=UPI0037B46DFE
MSETWTIGELAERAADALRPGLQRANGRIREVPGERLIRWYTTIGLVDPPLTRRGRIAQYGRRHLLQVVAVKRLQAAGHSIAEIQTRLTGATDATLEAAALLELPDAPRAEGARPRFWTTRPATDIPVPADIPATADAPARAKADIPAPVGGGRVSGVRLAPGVALVLDGAGRTPTDDDIEAVLAAAGPLLRVLQERKLT